MSPQVNLGDQLQLLNLVPVSDITSSSVSSAIDLSLYQDEIGCMIDVKNIAGSSPTLALKLTECDTSGGSYTDVTGGGFTSLTTVAAAQLISLNKNELKRFVKLSWTIGGTMSPEYYLSAKIVGMKKYPDQTLP
jgi:hypothetical protein